VSLSNFHTPVVRALRPRQGGRGGIARRLSGLEQLRDDVRHGLESGASHPWSAEDAKREGRARRERKLA